MQENLLNFNESSLDSSPEELARESVNPGESTPKESDIEGTTPPDPNPPSDLSSESDEFWSPLEAALDADDPAVRREALERVKTTLDAGRPVMEAMLDWRARLLDPSTHAQAAAEMQALIDQASPQRMVDEKPSDGWLDEIQDLLAERRLSKLEADFRATALEHFVAPAKGIGWEVSPEMAWQAFRRFPDRDPLTALKSTFPDAYADYRAALATQQEARKAAPTLPLGAISAKGIEFTEPADGNFFSLFAKAQDRA
jgi:hypothetical protein